MNSERLLKDLRSLKGRKVEDILESANYICIHFDDNTFCVFEANQRLKDPPQVNICPEDAHIDLGELWDLGIITDAEHEVLTAEKQQRLERWEELREEFGT